GPTSASELLTRSARSTVFHLSMRIAAAISMDPDTRRSAAIPSTVFSIMGRSLRFPAGFLPDARRMFPPGFSPVTLYAGSSVFRLRGTAPSLGAYNAQDQREARRSHGHDRPDGVAPGAARSDRPPGR